MAGAAAQVGHRVGHAVLEVVERFEQPRLDLALQRRRSFIRARRARERAPHLARIEHAAHGSSRRKPSSSAATSSAWVRHGAWPPCSTLAYVAYGDRQRVGWGQSVSVRVSLGGCGILKKKK